jgi:hypothetical protein
MIHCEICYSLDTEDFLICDMCERQYCYDCSYIFTIHYQHQGSRCYICSEQKRRKPLTKEDIRDNKITLIECQPTEKKL